MARRTSRWTAATVATVVVAGGTAALVAGAGPGAAAQSTSWQQVLEPDRAPEASITGAQRIEVVSHVGKGRGIDVGPQGDSPGDYFVLQERLTQGDAHVGQVDAECMLLFRTVKCEGTFTLDGRGTLEIAGVVPFRGGKFAVTGGTGDFRNVRGQMRITDESRNSATFVFQLLP